MSDRCCVGGSIFEDGESEGMIAFVGQTDPDLADAEPFGSGGSGAVEDDFWGADCTIVGIEVAQDLNVEPAGLGPDPHSERLGNGFFSGKASCITLSPASRAAFIAVVALHSGKMAGGEGVGVTVEHPLNPLDDNNVSADADNHLGFGQKSGIVQLRMRYRAVK